MSDQGWLDTQMIEVLDNAIAALRFCHDHPIEHQTAGRLRDLKMRLGYLALALEWDEAGDFKKADRAIARARGRIDPKYRKPSSYERIVGNFH